MNNYIQELLNFFYNFSDELSSNNIISKINKNQISIDYLSDNKKGDVASNFYLIIKRKIINKNYDFISHLNEKIIKIDFIKNFELSKNGFININLSEIFISRSLSHFE